MRDLFAEGALSTAFTTVFTKKLEQEGDAPAWHLANLVLTILTVTMGLICFLGILFAPWIVEFMNPGFHSVAGKFELTVKLTRILFPFIGLVSVAALVMGMLNSKMIFGIPSSASSAFNFVSVIAGVALAYAFSPQQDWRSPHFDERGVIGISLGVLLGGLAQLLIQLPSLWKVGFRFKWKWDLSHPGLREVWVLMIPSVIAGSAVQVNVSVNGIFASHIDGAYSWLSYAFRLLQFPIGVFGVAIATATLPAVARQQARNDLVAFGVTLKQSLRFMFFLTIPSMLGLLFFAPQIIQVLFERGRFHASDTHQTALALQAYLLGLVGYAGIKVLTPCFYALGLPKVPLRVSLLSMGLNLVLNGVMFYFFHLGHIGLALSTGFLAMINFLQLFFAMRRHLDLGTLREWTIDLSKIFFAAILAVLLAREAGMVADICLRWEGTPFVQQILRLSVILSIAGAAYLGIGWLLKMEEMTSFVLLLKRKLGKK